MLLPRPEPEPTRSWPRRASTTRRVGRTFALACRLLPRDVRDDVYRLYLVFRTLDDLVDDATPPAPPAPSPPSRRGARTGRVALARGGGARRPRHAATPLPRARAARLLPRDARRPRRAAGPRPRPTSTATATASPAPSGVVMAAMLGARRAPAPTRQAAALGHGDAAHEHPARPRRGPRRTAAATSRSETLARFGGACAPGGARGARCATRSPGPTRSTTRAWPASAPLRRGRLRDRARRPRCTARSCARSSARATAPGPGARSSRRRASSSWPRGPGRTRPDAGHRGREGRR